MAARLTLFEEVEELARTLRRATGEWRGTRFGAVPSVSFPLVLVRRNLLVFAARCCVILPIRFAGVTECWSAA